MAYSSRRQQGYFEADSNAFSTLIVSFPQEENQCTMTTDPQKTDYAYHII
jgi:hypothetical protein